MMANRTRKTSRGASATKQRERSRFFTLPRIGLRVAMGLVLFLGLGGVGCFGYLALNNATRRPIQSVAIEGEFVYVNQQEVAEMLDPIIVDGFLRLPLMSVKKELEQHPWIAEVNVSRRWPDTLFVAITEEQAIARWSDTGFLNQHGKIVPVEQTPMLASLPWLDGKEEDATTLMQLYQQFSQLLRPQGLMIRTFQADETGSMTVVLSNELILYLGKDEVMEKFQRFLVVLQHSMVGRLNNVASVDLRYNNGLAVAWRQNETESENIVGENIIGENTVADRGRALH